MNETAFNDLYQRSYHRIAAQVYLMCGDLSEAEECTQEAFAIAWAKRRQLRADEQPEAWIRTAARRVSIGRWRKTRRMVPSAEPRERPADLPDQATRIAVHQALAQLPAATREAIVLHHFCDLSIADIAAETHHPEGTVKARLSRGRARLAQLLGESGDAAVTATLRQAAAPALALPLPTVESIHRRAGGQRRTKRVLTAVAATGIAVVCLAALMIVIPRLPGWQRADGTPTTFTTPDPGGTPSDSDPSPNSRPSTGPGWERVPTAAEVSAFEPGDLRHHQDQPGFPTGYTPSVCAVDVPSLGATSILTRTFTGAGEVQENVVVMEFAGTAEATAARETIRYVYFNGCAPSGKVADPELIWTDGVPVTDAGQPGETWAELSRVRWPAAGQRPGGFEDALVVQVGNRISWLVLHLGGVAEHDCDAVDEAGGEVCGIVSQIPAVAARLA